MGGHHQIFALAADGPHSHVVPRMATPLPSSLRAVAVASMVFSAWGKADGELG